MKRSIAKLLTSVGIGLFLGLGALGVSSSIVHAADATTDGLEAVGGETGLSTTDPKIIIGNIIRTGLGVLGIILVCFMVYGGFVWMTAAGNPERVDKAKKILVNAVIGLIIILLSWSITSFVINSLLDATGSSGGSSSSGGGSGGGYGLGGGSSSSFTVTGYSPEGAVTIRNIVPRITFSKTVDKDTVDANVVIADASGTAVAGTFMVTGNVVKFTPTAVCPDPNTDRFCFDENAVFTVTVGAGVLSSGGSAVECDSVSSPCTSTFTSGSLVDTDNPDASITVPTTSVASNSTADFQVAATDDAGVAGADFLVDDEWQDSVSADGTVSTTISTVLDTSSLVDGTKYTFMATVIDFAGNEDSDTVSVRARPATCFNETLDASAGETGIDCGGDSSSTSYCGACSGDSCTTSADCSSGMCTDGVCVANPLISGVSPQDGAVGTYVTISGSDFGANTGTILFTDTAGTGTIEAEVLTSCGGGWGGSQVVVVVPEGAGDGPISITTANGDSDATDDDSGALVPNFDVNATVHPGLCALSKSSGTSSSALTLTGVNFGEAQGTSTVAFAATAAGSYTSWADETVKVTVPEANAGDYDVGVTVGGVASNVISFTVAEASVDASSITDISPASGGIGQYVTLSGTNFGTSVGTVTFTSTTGETATGSIDFPSACSSDFWEPEQVIFIVPETFDDAAATALTSGVYSVTITNQSGVTSSAASFTVTDTEPTPGICGITATADVGDTITISGDQFGLATDTLTFYSGVTSLTATSWNNSTITALVPSGAVTGPVTVTVAGSKSNSANLTVGEVAEDEPDAVYAAYAWDFSTGQIMRVPTVVSECSDTTISSVPNDIYSEEGEICVNAVVYAEFSTLMNEGSVTDAISVVECTAAVASATDDPCATTEEVAGSATAASSTTATRVTWIPTQEFTTNSVYRVTLSTTAKSTDSIAMARDVTWDFTTSTSAEHCVVDRVTVTPAEDTIAAAGDAASFAANAGTGCVLVDSSAYSWDWSVDSYSYVDFDEVSFSDCEGDPTACGAFYAIAEGTTVVTATALNASGAGDVSDDASLVVNFTDPYISDYAPDCEEACTNALISASFSTAVVKADVTTGDHVLLYSCTNELCTNLTLVDSNPECVYESTDTDEEHCMGFQFPLEPLVASGYYRVIVSGEITSESGVALIRTNYGTDYSWTFRVREDGTACAVDRISITPSASVVASVGARTSFTADAYGAADSCSTSGQQLVGTSYNWGWTDPIENDAQNNDDAPVGTYTAAWQTVDDVLLDGGPSAIPEGCSSLCTPIGSSPDQAVCGDGVIDENADGGGEECDDSNTTDHDGCSSTCLLEGSSVCAFTCTSTGVSCTADSQCAEVCDTETLTCSGHATQACAVDSDCPDVAATCETVGANCCGNAAIDVAYDSDIAESCDDGNIVDGDGCAASCVAEGSASVGSTCGNSDIAFDATTHAGELCDDGNNASGDGCSRLCLPEGSQSLALLGNALCGDSEITSPYETCDDGNTTDNDGCSSTCVREGLLKCTATLTTQCCGNAILEQNSVTSAGEDCDPASGVEGCTSSCMYEGSSVDYAAPSVCGDGVEGIGEFPSCEPATSSGDGYPDPTQVAYMTDDAVFHVSTETDQAIGTVKVSEPTSGLYITSDFALTCAASSDLDCLDPDTGVGLSNCCVPRPTLTSSAPAGAEVCRNAAIYGVFSEEMNTGSFTYSESVAGTTTTTPYMYLKLTLASGQTCPDGYTTLAVTKMNFFAKVMSTVRTFFLGETAEAAVAAGAADTGDCIMPIDSYSQSDVSTATATAFKVAMGYRTALEANSTYTLVFVGDDTITDAVTDGITSKLGAGMDGTQSVTFVTGPDICTLDMVDVEDTSTESPNTFTTTGESHTFTATAISYANNTSQEIAELPGVYDWTWSAWESSDATLFTATQGGASVLDTATVVSVGDNGEATVIASATVSDYTSGVLETSTVQGTSDVTALLCENPWPAVASYPWTDDGTDSGSAVGNNGYMNFSLGYCQDYEEDGVLTDDLPDVSVVLAPMSPSTAVLKEYLFEIDTTSSTAATDDAGDVIGVRIMSNPEHLNPLAWYKAQGFTGSPAETTIDGFQALTDSRSTYVAMANSTTSGLYTNILVISYNEGASVVTQAVYEEMVANLSFLTNVASTAVCSSTASTSCTADAECPSGETCLDDKSKITRDTKRMGDLKDIATSVEEYSDENQTCSATTAQSCSDDSDCPDGETCEATIPTLSSGTAVRSLVSSAWGSWVESFGGALDGSDVPTDPLNSYAACTGYDSATCVNQTSGSYSCPDGSYVYHYRAVGAREYELAMDLEYTATSWVSALDSDSTDNVTYYTSSYCDGDVYGTSSACGDGIIGLNASGVTEICETGDVQSAACIYDAGTDATSTSDDTMGTANAECNSTCLGYDAVAADATCSADSCGDGVVNGTETCDDGVMNGEYGYCGDLCSYTGATYCGDGVISGGEVCDCGDSTMTNAAILGAAKPYGGSSGSCTGSHTAGSNGTYAANLNTTCAWDCGGPASYCGDVVVDAGESCDGDTDSWEGALCGDHETECTSDADCVNDGTTDHQCGAVYGSCPTARVCRGGSMDGYPCSIESWPAATITEFGQSYLDGVELALWVACLSGATTDSSDDGLCDASDQVYQTAYTRSCDDDTASTSTCGWNTWNYCNYNGQSCGNGVIDGSEECDDGNDVATDACTTICTTNVCGDAYIYDGLEECDEGTENGAGCDSAYESTCTACSTSCYYTTQSGEFCGDGVINGDELCDGADVPYYWYDDSYEIEGDEYIVGNCTAVQNGKSYYSETGDYYRFTNDSGADFSTTVMCYQVGLCSGGDNNGEYCGVGNTYEECTGGTCVAPVCDASCGVMCPTSQETGTLLLTSNLAGASEESDVDLYSYNSESTANLPNAATITVPACTTAGNLIADVDFAGVEAPDVYVVFVTDVSGSMATTDMTSAKSRISVAQESINTAIGELYDELGDKVHIGLVSYSSTSTVGTKDADGGLIFIDQDYSDPDTGADAETTLTSKIDAYVASGGTETDDGLDDAQTLLATITDTSNIAKIIILLSDGAPNSESAVDTEALALLKTSGIETYTLALTTTDTLETDMDRWSSNSICESTDTSLTSSCDIDEYVTDTAASTYDPDSSEDFNDSNLIDYSYSGSSTSEVESAYSTIIDSITSGQVVLFSSADGVVETTDPGSVDDSHNISLPWPENFVCDGVTETELPVQVTFRGEGIINISNVRIDYCAP